eukprot:767927-Hanusia_phi.AAC.3
MSVGDDDFSYGLDASWDIDQRIMYDIIDAHEHLETHHAGVCAGLRLDDSSWQAVGKCVIQIRKTIPEEEDNEGLWLVVFLPLTRDSIGT